MKRCAISEGAAADLISIHDYIAQDDPLAASKLIDQIAEKFGLIAEFPKIGRSANFYQKHSRMIPVGEYVIFYQITPEGSLVTHICHGRRDLRAFFQTDPLG